MAFFAGGDGEVAEIKTLYVRSFFLSSLEGFFQENFCVASSSRAAKDSQNLHRSLLSPTLSLSPLKLCRNRKKRLKF
jgi:hypothetical protein